MATVEKPILVGVDGSEPSLAACRWAAAEASLRGRSIQLIYGYIGPALALPLMAPPYDWLPEMLQKEGDDLIAQAIAVVRQAAPEVPVTGQVLAGAAGQLLVELSQTAYLVVVGHRGHGGFASLLLGSTASTVAAHAHSPVVVIRPGPADTGAAGPVVVGVDGSEAAQAALELGFEEAELRGVVVHAVHAYHSPPPPWRADVHYDPAEVETAVRHQLAEWIRPINDKYPRVPVTLVVRPGQPAERLVDAAHGAQLLVVGSRGRGGFTGLLLGSVSQQVIRHASGPVAIAR